MKYIENALTINNLTVAYNESPVLYDISLNLPKGNLIAIIGPNGAGKTTLVKTILGLIKPISGKINFDEITQKGGTLKNKIAYVPQTGSVDWDFPAIVLDVVMMGRYGHLGWFKRPGKKEKQMAYNVLEKVGIKEYAKRQISQLSGGQQQRVFLARALIQDAEIYFMDEPFKGVDIKTEKSIIKLLKDLRENGKTVIVVHHDLHTVLDYFDWVTMINKNVIANGVANEVFNEKNINETYGGYKMEVILNNVKLS